MKGNLKQVVRFSIIDSSSYLFLAILTAVLNAFVSSQYGPEFLIVVSVVTLNLRGECERNLHRLLRRLQLYGKAGR